MCNYIQKLQLIKFPLMASILLSKRFNQILRHIQKKISAKSRWIIPPPAPGSLTDTT